MLAAAGRACETPGVSKRGVPWQLCGVSLIYRTVMLEGGKRYPGGYPCWYFGYQLICC